MVGGGQRWSAIVGDGDGCSDWQGLDVVVCNGRQWLVTVSGNDWW